jgi:hypothetical protein
VDWPWLLSIRGIAANFRRFAPIPTSIGVPSHPSHARQKPGKQSPYNFLKARQKFDRKPGWLIIDPNADGRPRFPRSPVNAPPSVNIEKLP